MKRFAFKMSIKEKGCEKEYAKRHAAIWPELKQMIKDQGVSDYSIFWDKTPTYSLPFKNAIVIPTVRTLTNVADPTPRNGGI